MILRVLSRILCIEGGYPWVEARCLLGDPGWGLARWASLPSLGERCARFLRSSGRLWSFKGCVLGWRRACWRCAPFSGRSCSPFWQCSQKKGRPRVVGRLANATPLGPMGGLGRTLFQRSKREGVSYLVSAGPWLFYRLLRIFPARELLPGGSSPWRAKWPGGSWLGCGRWARYSCILSLRLCLGRIIAQSRPSRMGYPGLNLGCQSIHLVEGGWCIHLGTMGCWRWWPPCIVFFMHGSSSPVQRDFSILFPQGSTDPWSVSIHSAQMHYLLSGRLIQAERRLCWRLTGCQRAAAWEFQLCWLDPLWWVPASRSTRLQLYFSTLSTGSS